MGIKMNKGLLLLLMWQVCSFITLIYLLFFNSSYNWWNWIIVIPINFILAELWPIYWLLKLVGFAS